VNPDRFKRMKAILLRVVDLPETERKAVLYQTCADDPELRVAVEELLTHDSQGAGSGGRASSDDTVTSLSPGRFPPGMVLGDRYRIESLLGHGGMGEVYCARDLDLGVPVALKTIRPEIASDPFALRLFKQEVLLARSVTHPNVCRIYDQGRHRDATQDVTFLTMEFLPGETLAARIGSRGRMSRTEALPIAKQMAEALDAAHRAGIVHRDFKSANVMLVPSDAGERTVITDFGLAVESATRHSRDASAAVTQLAEMAVSDAPVLLGTPAYMSPEQVRGERVGPAADLYALGIVLFEMATGSVPFSGNTPLDTARQRLSSPPPPPSTLAEVDPEWEAAILRLLSLEPEARFASAAEAVAALEGREISPQEGPGPTTPRRPRFFLPAERDVFVGRTRELQDLADRLEGGPSQVTVLGAGGSGKTRLARRYGWTSLDRWPGGIWFCDLSEASTADGIAHAVATGLDVPLGRGDPIVQLGHAIAGRGRALIILDNFEQVREHAEATVGRWITRARDSSFLITSRERLRFEGETVLELDPLDAETEGVELFAERARAEVAGFTLDSNRTVVRDIVHLVDGLPLAIELAAARLRTLSLEQLRARLVDRLSLLAGPKRGRQATLRATLDWSWELLTPWEQTAVAQASVFEGGFTLEAAEAVLDVTSWPGAPAVLDVVQALVDKSWVRARSVLDAPRFEMYATVREYASEKLKADRGEVGLPAGTTSREAAERRHGVYYASMGTEEAVEALDRHGGVAKIAALRMEIDNLVAACRRAVERADPDTAVGAFVASWRVLSMNRPVAEGVNLGQTVMGIPRIRPAQRARTALHLGQALRIVGRVDEARRCFEEALAVHRVTGDRRSEGLVLGNLGNLLTVEGQVEEASRCFEAALAIHREMGHRRFEGNALGNLGNLHIMVGHVEEARQDYENALAILREVGDRRTEGVFLGNLGRLHGEQGRKEEARLHFEEALAIFREVGDRRNEGIFVGNLGVLNQDRVEEARRYFQEALAIHRDTGNRQAQGIFLGNLGVLLLNEGRTEEARTHFEEALAISREVGDRRNEGLFLGKLGNLHSGQGRMEEARRCFDDGLAVLRAIGDRLNLGETLCFFGHHEYRQANLPAAHSALAEADAIAESLGVTPDSQLAHRVAQLRQILGGEER
jgi:serine/threonine protein kinase/tetratricopeptide (TPR) repeat protein